jgi:hypothetical protein
VAAGDIGGERVGGGSLALLSRQGQAYTLGATLRIQMRGKACRRDHFHG